jgi:dynein heavy chain
VNIIIQLTKLLDSLFLPYLNNEKKGQLQLTSDFIHAIFLQAFIWSFGACLKQEDRILLDTFIKYLSGLSTPTMDSKAKSGQLPNEKPLLFDHIFQPELDQWIKWDDLIPKYEHDRSKRFTEIFVPTVDTIRLGMMTNSLDQFNELPIGLSPNFWSETETIPIEQSSPIYLIYQKWDNRSHFCYLFSCPYYLTKNV